MTQRRTRKRGYTDRRSAAGSPALGGYRPDPQRRRDPQRRPDPRRRPATRRSAPLRRRPNPAPARKKQHGWRWMLLPAAVLLIWLILTHYVFLIRNVQVVGAEDADAAAVVRLSGVPLGERMNAVNAENIKTNVESTGQLAFVSVEKRYPTTLVLTVRQRTRDAITSQAGKLLVLDTDGYVVSAGDAAPVYNVPYVLGLKSSTYRLGRQLDAPKTRLSAMKTILEALKAHNATEYVSEINLERLSDIEFISRRGIVVSMGDVENMNNKVIWMMGALQDLESRGETLGKLDVSSGSKADFLPGTTPTPAPTPVPESIFAPEPTQEAVIGDDAI